MPRTREHLVYRMKKGQVTGLESIYAFSGLFGSDWWEPINDTDSCGGVQPVGSIKATRASGETIRITRNITITISRTYGPA